MIITLQQLSRDISASGKNGETVYQFVSLPAGENFSPFVRPQDVPGAVVTSRAQFGSNAAARHSSTEVEVDLPDGAIVKTVKKTNRYGTTSSAEIVRGETLVDICYVGSSKIGSGWASVVEIDSKRVTIAG